MNVLVIGLGSMGKRRIRLISEMYPMYDLYGVDNRKDRREEVEKRFNIKTFQNIDDKYLKDNIDSAFVCTSPLSHNSIIKQCLDNKWDVFTELNLVSDGYDENIKLADKNGCTLFLSSTFLYREEIKFIRKKIDDKHKWNYNYHIGQYLPDWHPWESFNDFFIGNKRTNGCREIMAIELPWLIKTFGDIESFNVISDKITDLNIDYNDNYIIQFIHKNGNKGSLNVDIVSPVAVRNMEIYTEHKYFCWNGTHKGLYQYDAETKKIQRVILDEKEEHIDGYSDFITENAYKSEIREFMEVLEGKKKEIYSFKDDLKILNLIDKLENKN